MKKLIFFVLLAACSQTPPRPEPIAPAAPAPAPAADSNHIPVEDFFRNPALASVHISPDGTTLAYLKSWKSRMNVFVMPLLDPQAEKQITFVEDRNIVDLAWKEADTILYQKDLDGDENFHIFSVNILTSASRDLTPYAGVRAGFADPLEDVSKTDVLITMNLKNRQLFDLYRVNVQSGALKLVTENKYKLTHWLIDHEGRARGGLSDDGVDSIFYFEKVRGKPFVPIFKTDFRNSFQPIGFTSDNQHIYVMSNLNRDLIELVEIDPNLPEKNFVLKTLYRHPKYDLGGGTYSPARKTLDRLWIVTDRAETVFLVDKDQADWEELRRLFGGQSLAISNMSRDENMWVVRTLSDRSRGEYFVFNRTTRKTWSLGQVAPWLNPAQMAEMKTIHYNARDGLNIEGYLTLPRNRPAKNLPVVVNPHGGPWARDEWRFNPEAQFLASRGYAVLQMNFRGSTSYGRKFWQASFKNWGLSMQDDITDGVKWLVGQGIADPRHICIYGASYGGYATLAGVTYTPKLYACAVDYVGVSNLMTFMKTIPPYWKPFLEMMYAMVGNPEKDKALMEAASPALHADRIKTPLFIAQGANDPRVNKAESDQMVEALRKRGVTVEYMVKNNEGHGFHNEENRFDFYRTMEKFLAKHLGPTEVVR